MKKPAEITSFYTCTPKITIIWGTVPLIWFLSIKKWKNTWRYHYFTQVYCKWQSYGSWDMDILSFWAFFCQFWKNKKNKTNKQKQKQKTSWRYHYFTQVYQKSWHMLHCSSDMLCDRLFFILGYFLHFHPPKGLKNKK